LEYFGDSLQWNVTFTRAAHDWEVDVFASFFNLLYSVRMRRDGVDKLWWSSSKKELFGVSSYYSVLVGNNVSFFPWKSIWKTKVLLMVAFFAWSMVLGKILSMDNIRNRHVIVIDRCCICKRNVEFVDNLLLHCEVSCTLWNAIFSRFGLFWVCLAVLSPCLLVGGLVEKLRVPLFGRWYLPVPCGVFGGKEMTKVLRTVRDRQRSLSLSSIYLDNCICSSLGA